MAPLNAENLGRLDDLLHPDEQRQENDAEDLGEFSFVCEPSTSDVEEPDGDGGDISMQSSALNDSVSSANFVQMDAVNMAEISQCATIKPLDTMTNNNVSGELYAAGIVPI